MSAHIANYRLKEGQKMQKTLNRNLAQMLKGGVIMDVTTPEEAKIAQECGAVAVMALERVPSGKKVAWPECQIPK